MAGMTPVLLTNFLTFLNNFQMAQTTKLTDAQLQANKNAIHLFIAQATAKYGRGSVILLPEFIEQGDGTWIPKADSTGRRATDSGSAFLRLGKQYLISNGKTNKVSYMFTNEFADSDEDLHSFLLYVDPNAVVGGAVRGCRLVIHESLKPFSKVNPERDIKWANREQGLKCTKYVVDLDTAEMKQMPIYRRTKAFFADDNGEFPFFKPENDSFEEVQKCAMKTAKDFFILHDNEEELSDAAVARVLADRKTKDDNAAIEKAKQNRLAELYVDPNAVVGGAVRGCRLVIHESLKPFSKVNPERDIKWANREQGLKCTKYVVDLDTAEMKQMPIYRRTKAFFADDNGEFPFFKPENDSFEEVQKCAMKTAKDFFILHDNEEELSDAAVARVLADRKTKDDNAAIEKAKQNRLAELQGKATLSAAETQELKTLAPKPVAETPTVPTTGETDKVPF